MTITDGIEVFKQNSIRINTCFGAVYIDPFQVDSRPHDAAYILITHDHYDHFSPEDIEKVSSGDTILVVPEKMKGKAQEASGPVKEIRTVKPGVYEKINDLEFETVRAYNNLKPFHPKKAEWVGYILQLEGHRIYIAGDTDATREAKEVKCDVALVPIGGTFTMDAKSAAELVNILGPDVAIPTHYGSIVGSREDENVFAEYVKEPIKVEFKIPF